MLSILLLLFSLILFYIIPIHTFRSKIGITTWDVIQLHKDFRSFTKFQDVRRDCNENYTKSMSNNIVSVYSTIGCR